MYRSLPAVPARAALAWALLLGGPGVAAWSSAPPPTAAPASEAPAAPPPPAVTAPEVLPDPPGPDAAIPALQAVPLEGRVAIGAASIAGPTNSTRAAELARSLATQLGRPARTQAAPGVLVCGVGEFASIARTTRRLGRQQAEIRRLLRMNEGDAVQVVMLERSREAYDTANATLFGQMPLATRTAVLGAAEDRIVVLAWEDPDAGSFLAASARALAMAAILGGDLLRPVPANSSEENPDESDAPVAPSGGPPAWFVEGLASQLASVVASPNALEPRQRETGLRFLRGGGDPRRIFALSPDDPAWIALDGAAQSVAFLAVQRLAEDTPANLDRLIAAIRGGRSWPEAWKATLGGTPSSLAERLVRHHAVND